jgi:hypothetical protein
MGLAGLLLIIFAVLSLVAGAAIKLKGHRIGRTDA